MAKSIIEIHKIDDPHKVQELLDNKGLDDRKSKKSKFNNHQIAMWVDRGIDARSNNQKRLDKKRTNKMAMFKEEFNIERFNDNVPKADDYRDDLVEYLGKTVEITGTVINVHSVRPHLKRITLGSIKVDDIKLNIDHLNVLVSSSWLYDNPDCVIGAVYRVRGIIHEYLKKNGKRNIGCFAKHAKLIKKAKGSIQNV